MKMTLSLMRRRSSPIASAPASLGSLLLLGLLLLSVGLIMPTATG